MNQVAYLTTQEGEGGDTMNYDENKKTTYEEVDNLAKMLACIQTLPLVERIAVQYYLKGVLDNSVAQVMG